MIIFRTLQLIVLFLVSPHVFNIQKANIELLHPSWKNLSLVDNSKAEDTVLTNKLMEDLKKSPEDIEWEKYQKDEVDEFELYQEKAKRENDFLYLFQAKNYLINGNLKRADFYLDKIDDKKSKLTLVKKRFKAIIAFINGDYYRVNGLLDSNYFNNAKYYPEICLLKVVALLALQDTSKLEYESSACRAMTYTSSINNQIWIDSIIDLVLKKPYALKGGVLQNSQFILNDPEYLRIWLKLAIYLNREELALANINDIPEDAYFSKKTREMIGMIHYRNGNYDKALKFVEDIETSNAENIKGNINLSKSEYELAYGHFKLALKDKSNSYNAIERAIPLTWLLGIWDDGITMLNRVKDLTKDERKKIALETAFLLRKNEFKKAEKNLYELKYLYRDRIPTEVEMMWMYTSLMNNDRANFNRYVESSCRKFDGLSCWAYLQNYQWSNFSLVIKRDEEIRQDKNFTAETLKDSQSINKLTETKLVDQRDIDELDSSSISIELENQ